MYKMEKEVHTRRTHVTKWVIDCKKKADLTAGTYGKVTKTNRFFCAQGKNKCFRPAICRNDVT